MAFIADRKQAAHHLILFWILLLFSWLNSCSFPPCRPVISFSIVSLSTVSRPKGTREIEKRREEKDVVSFFGLSLLGLFLF
jgi:hypothetical protein